MNNLVVFNICIISLDLCILVSLTTVSELGISSCSYLGEMEEDGKKCHEDVVKLEKLPKQCSSFVYDGVMCKEEYIIEIKDTTFGLERLGSLVEFEGRSHPVFLFFSHGDYDQWYSVLYEGDFKLVAQNVQNFIRDYPVKGLILHGTVQPTPVDKFDIYFEKFTAYVKAIKEMNPNLEIGLHWNAKTFIQSAEGSDTAYNMDFSRINLIMDFYLIGFSYFNECSDDLLRSGITPMDSANPDVMTLNRFATALENSTIAKDKMYFDFSINPIPKNDVKHKFNPCEISYNEYCENEDDKRSIWCADNTGTLNEKGTFTKKHARGFVGGYIDLVDRDDKCKCGKYSTFEMMLNGFNGGSPMKCEALEGV
ncbi:uncharacterized protein LOC111041620 [Myzus persicae]|uniref:uncharacterized protein LOC111041620 n=1 Tax=Myzus persicae TaxID=13164 RepID=UPI000B935CD8|nr:uncharacterized protein LOC111041620 [Myzus persicae]